MRKRVYRKKQKDAKKRTNKTIYFVFIVIISLIFLYYISYFISRHVIQKKYSLPLSPLPSRHILSLIKSPLITLDVTVESQTKDKKYTLIEGIVTHGSREKKTIALTFDGDMTPSMVKSLKSGRTRTYDDTRITDALVQSETKATFFLTGLWIEQYPEQTRMLATNPLFELANHSYSHPAFTDNCYNLPHVPQTQYTFEITKTQQLLQQYGNVTTKYFRFPGGCSNHDSLNLIKKEELMIVHWDVAADDGFNSNTNQIVDNVVSQTQNGSIIVMHLGGETNTPKTAEALPRIVDRLKKKGYTFLTISELLYQKQHNTINLHTLLSNNK
jgi:peptidoglycan/xylan/chitin deacetylase (PgdA/CDA1 family)